MTVINAILSVFTAVTSWFADTISSVEPMFWNAETGLTFIGVLSAVGVAIAVTLLVVNWIKSFIHLR